MAEFRLAPKAEDDLEDIWLFGFGKWGQLQADKYAGFMLENTSASAVIDPGAFSAPFQRGMIDRTRCIFLSSAPSIFPSRGNFSLGSNLPCVSYAVQTSAIGAAPPPIA